MGSIGVTSRMVTRDGKQISLDNIKPPRVGSEALLKQGSKKILVSTLKKRALYMSEGVLPGDYVGKSNYQLFLDNEGKFETYDKWEDARTRLKDYFK